MVTKFELTHLKGEEIDMMTKEVLEDRIAFLSSRMEGMDSEKRYIISVLNHRIFNTDKHVEPVGSTMNLNGKQCVYTIFDDEIPTTGSGKAAVQVKGCGIKRDREEEEAGPVV